MPPDVRTPDPWRRAPVGELSEPLLPRWFVVLALAMVLLAAIAAIAALAIGGRGGVGVAERRPPPAGGLTADVGALEVGEASPAAYDRACPMLAGVQIAGSDADRAVLRQGLAALCNAGVDEQVAQRLTAFAESRGVVRFARFELTGVDSAADLGADPPVIYLNARFSRTDPLWIAPAVAHEVTYLEADASTADGAVEARRVEHDVCERVLSGQRWSRACEDAAALLALDDPRAALREAGFR